MLATLLISETQFQAMMPMLPNVLIATTTVTQSQVGDADMMRHCGMQHGTSIHRIHQQQKAKS